MSEDKNLKKNILKAFAEAHKNFRRSITENPRSIEVQREYDRLSSYIEKIANSHNQPVSAFWAMQVVPRKKEYKYTVELDATNVFVEWRSFIEDTLNLNKNDSDLEAAKIRFLDADIFFANLLIFEIYSFFIRTGLDRSGIFKHWIPGRAIGNPSGSKIEKIMTGTELLPLKTLKRQQRRIETKKKKRQKYKSDILGLFGLVYRTVSGADFQEMMLLLKHAGERYSHAVEAAAQSELMFEVAGDIYCIPAPRPHESHITLLAFNLRELLMGSLSISANNAYRLIIPLLRKYADVSNTPDTIRRRCNRLDRESVATQLFLAVYKPLVMAHRRSPKTSISRVAMVNYLAKAETLQRTKRTKK